MSLFLVFTRYQGVPRASPAGARIFHPCLCSFWQGLPRLTMGHESAMPLVINGERIPDEEIAREAQSLQQTFAQMPPEVREARGLDAAQFESNLWGWSKENVIERVLLRQEAAKDTAPVPDEEIDAALEQIKKRHGGSEQFSLSRDESEIRGDVETRVRLDRLIGSVTSKVKPPKNKDVADFYRKHKSDFALPEQVRAAHIVKNVDDKTDEATAREEMRKVEEEIERGDLFEEVADRHSDCPGNGGDLGYFARGQMVDEFDEVVFNMEPGSVSEVFRTSFGFHIAKLHEKTPAHVRNLQEAGDEIKEELLRRKSTKAIEDFVDRLKTEAEIEEIVAAQANIAVKS